METVFSVKGVKDGVRCAGLKKLHGLIMVFWPQKSANHRAKITSLLSYLERFVGVFRFLRVDLFGAGC